MLTMQDRDELGLPISDDEEILHKAMKKAQEFTQTGIMEILEVDPMMWKVMRTPIPDIEDNTGPEDVKERLDDNLSRVRDHSPTLFKRTISKYVVRTIEAARNQEWKHFMTMLLEPNGPTEVYRLCGWTDLAEMDRTERARQFVKSKRILATVKLPGLEW